jgi:hypothetical protein
MRARLGVGVLVVFLLALWAAPPAAAQQVPRPPAPPSNDEPNEGLGFLIISLAETEDGTADFTLDGQTVVVALGRFTGGAVAGETRFVTVGDLVIPVTFPVNNQSEPLSLADLDGNQVTVIGTFETTGTEEEDPEIHLVTTDPGGVEDHVIEEAVYQATRDEEFADLFWIPDEETEDPDDGSARFPTAQEICEFIQETAGYVGESDEYLLDVQDIFNVVFAGDDIITFDGDNATIEAEGDGFIHDDDGVADISYQVAANEDGELTADVCTLVEIDVLTKKINLKSKGKLKVAILSSDTFDATEVDECTAQIGGVYAVKAKVKDVNKDCLDDLVVYFKIGDLVCAGVLDECTTELTLQADLLDDAGCIEVTDSVTVKQKDDCDDDCDDECDCGDDDCDECGKDKDDCDDDKGKDKDKDDDCDDDDEGKGKDKNDDKGKGKK